jgi:predicted PurR-regulated permease PerM
MKEGTTDHVPWIERILGLAVLALIAIGAFIVLRPFLSALLWAIIITYSTSTLYQRLSDWLHGRRSLAAMLMTLLLGALIVFPLVLVSFSLTDSVSRLVNEGREVLDRGIGPLPEWVGQLPIVGRPCRDYWATVAAGRPSSPQQSSHTYRPPVAGCCQLWLALAAACSS